MKTVFNMKNLMIMKNYNKYICAFILLLGMSVNAWGVVTTAELNFGTAAVSETFEACTAGTQTTGSGSTTILSDMTSYGVFTHCYIGKTTGCNFSIQSAASPMTSKYLQLVTNTNTEEVAFTRSFTSTGAFTFKIAKSSKAYVGLYQEAPNSNAINAAQTSVYLNFTSSGIQIHNGSSWVDAMTMLPSTGVLEIAVIYNNTTSNTTYGNDIPLSAKRAHIYVNGTAIMDSGNPKEFTIPGRSLTYFRVGYGSSATTIMIDDINIYGALPTKAGNTITLNKNNVDDGSTGGTGTILTDATSMTIDAAPTRTGYTVEGYYTAASDGVKIAAANGALQSNVTVSSTSWTNGSGVWQNVGDKTFYTYWSPIEYIIEYNKNNSAATGTMEDQEFVYGTAQNLSKCGFSREGYTFSGWATTADGGKEYDDEEEVNNLTSTEDDIITLFAVWTPNNYKLTVGTPSNVTIKATPEDKSDITEGNFDAAVPCDAIITLDAVVDAGYSQAGWKITKDADGSDVTTSYLYDETTMFMPPFDATITATMYGDFVFSCSELTLTPHLATTGTPIFITSTASKTVRSQDYIEITGSGLTPSTALTFPSLPSKFAIKNADGTAVTTDGNGAISTNAYIFYTPGSGDTSDGLDKLTGITVSVDGAKPKTVNLTQEIIGRHLPADFVIAGKKDGKWYALPATMETGSTPDPDEIAIDDSHNPGIAYTSENNVYGLEGPSATNISGGNGQYVKLTMSQLTDGTGSGGPAPLYASNSANIGKNGTAGATSDLSTGWWWALTQTATDITNPQDAKYTIKSPNNSNTLSIKNKPFVWGLYASGVEELRLIPRSNLTFTEAEVIAWGQKNLIVQVDKDGISATQVQAKLNGSTSSRKSLATTTGTSVKGSATKYNYTLDFTDEFDFSKAAATDKTLLFEWLDAEGEILKVSSVVVPKIIASSSTMSSINSTKGYWKDLEVHVLPGVTLTANTASFSGAMTIKQLEIYPGATVQITTASAAGTLTVDSLIFRNGWNRLTGAKSYDVARLYIQPYESASAVAAGLVTNTTEAGAYMDWYIDYDQYYPIAVPFPVATSSISYKNTTSAASKGVKLRYYDGARRAANVQQNQDQNWVEYNWDGTDPAVPTNLEPSHGYIMTAKRPTGKAFSIIRMPLTIPSASWIFEGEKGVVDETHKDQVTVTAWGNENTPSYAKGWNIIANPYMSLHQGELSYDDESGEVIEYANIPDINFKEYDQLPIDATKLKPSSAFLIQAPKDGTVTFGTANRKAAAPSYRQNMQAETYPRQKAYIVLASEDAEDMMGIWISDKYSAEYEINADLEKLMGDGKSLRTYMHWNEMKMAYLAINKELAQQYIPVSVRIETEGKHTFSMHSASKISELKSVYLIDFETGAVTNLLESSYPFYSTAGTINDRFAINALVGPRDIPTDLDVISAGNEGTGPIKFIYHDKVFILHEGVIYDSTGKKVREIKK